MIKRVFSALKRNGFRRFITLLMIRLGANLIAFPFALVIAAIYPLIPIRLIRLYSSRIGHYALNTELLLCAMDTNLFDERKKIITLFYTAPEDPICNTQLHLMWKRVILILPFPFICRQIDQFLIFLLQNNYRNDPFKVNFENSSGGEDKWGLLSRIKKCHLSFTQSEKDIGNELMQQLGLPQGAHFICLLGRDSNYLKHHLPQTDWSYHDYRNVNINDYKMAAKLLAEKKYYVVRMGKYVNSKLDLENPFFIDYANNPLRSDFLDIYLSAHCYFMISSSCGLDSVAIIFRKPLLITNVPLCDVRSFYYWDLFISKNIFNLNGCKPVSFKEIHDVFYKNFCCN